MARHEWFPVYAGFDKDLDRCTRCKTQRTTGRKVITDGHRKVKKFSTSYTLPDGTVSRKVPPCVESTKATVTTGGVNDG